ncbi:MAG: DNA adenine methylase, partial [Deltaproteobacteria bacterium]
RYVNTKICNPEALGAAARALQLAELRVGDFETALAGAKRGDFVYFDPPYVPLSKTASFTAYAKGGFGEAEQRRLRDRALSLKVRRISVLLSNSSAPVVRELYARGFEHAEVQARRSIDCQPSGRAGVGELLFW